MNRKPDMEYPVAERALAKWSTERLDEIDRNDSLLHLRFRYNGSTCTNGGTPFAAHLHVCLEHEPGGRPSPPGDPIIKSAWIEIPDEHRTAASEMCAAIRPVGFLDHLAEKADITGTTLAEALRADVPVDYAGCFCAAPMVNEKWKLALSTIHYALAKGILPA